MIKTIFFATLIAVALSAPADDNKDESLDTAAQGIVGYAPGLYGAGIGHPGISTVYSTHGVYRAGYHGGLANLGYGGYGGFGGYGLGYGYPYGVGHQGLGIYH